MRYNLFIKHLFYLYVNDTLMISLIRCAVDKLCYFLFKCVSFLTGTHRPQAGARLVF